MALWGIVKWKWLWDYFSTFCCYEYGVYASEAVQNIATVTDQKDCHKCSLCVIVCYYQSITVKKRLVTYLLEHMFKKKNISFESQAAGH